MKRLSEDHKEIASGKRKDDEGYMAHNEMDTIEKSVKRLKKVIKSGDTQLPAWVQSKITKAADYIDTAADYLDSDEEIDEACWKGYKQIGMKKKGKKTVPNCVPEGKDISFAVKKSSGAGALTPDAAKQLGPKAIELQKKKAAAVSLPTVKKEELSLVEKILQEEGCECNKSKKEKRCPVHGYKDCSVKEEKDPKGPVQAYKSPKEIAKKHGVSLEAIKKQLEMGIKVEGEHTSDKTAARITALQHLDEVPDYYTKLKKVESKKTKSESLEIEDMFGNKFVEFIDLIKPEDIKKTMVSEATTRMKAQNGNVILATVLWRGKYYSMNMFFPQTKLPSRKEVTDELQKVYPGCSLVHHSISQIQPGQALIQAVGPQGGSSANPKPSKGYIRPMGEEFEIEEGMTIKDFKKQRSRQKQKEKRAADKIAPNRRAGIHADKASPERAARHRANVDPDFEGNDERNYPGGKLKNPKKIRKAKALGELGESAAWTRESGKNKEGGLNEKGRKSYERENPGSDLKAPSKKVGNPRRASFCARMKGMKSKLTSAKTANDPDSRINKSLRAWNC